MKTIISAALLSMAALSAGAYASSNVEPNDTPYQGVYGQVDNNASSAQVADQLAQAKTNGQYTFGELDYPAAVQGTPVALTRDQVKAELAQAKANGQYTFGELDYPPKN